MENAITYSDVLALNPNPVDLRIKMVQAAQQYGHTAPLDRAKIFRKLGFEKGGQIVKPRSERW